MKNIFPFIKKNNKLFVKESELDEFEIKTNTTPKAEHNTIGIRPENISIVNTKSHNKPENIFCGKIDKISDSGIYLDINILAAKHCFKVIWPRSYIREYKLKIGSKITFSIPLDVIHVF